MTMHQLALLMVAAASLAQMASGNIMIFNTGYSSNYQPFTGFVQNQGPDGIIYGVCAYYNPEGRYVKINFTETPDGFIDARAEQDWVEDPVEELRRCRAQHEKFAAELQEDLRKQQEQREREFNLQQQRLQEDMARLHHQLAEQQRQREQEMQQLQYRLSRQRDQQQLNMQRMQQGLDQQMRRLDRNLQSIGRNVNFPPNFPFN